METSALASWLPALIALAAGAFLFARRGPGPAAMPAKADDSFPRLVLDNSDDVAWLVDIETQRLVYLSPSAGKDRGWKVAEMIGKPAQELIQSCTDGKNLEALDALLRQRDDAATTTRIEISVPLLNGDLLPVETELKLIANAAGKPTWLLGVSRDISERRRLEQDLRDAEERVRLALHCSGDSVWDVNLRSGAMSYLEGWEDLFGYGEGDAAPTMEGFLRLIHGDDVAKVRAEMDRHLGGEVPSFQCECRIRTKEGGWRWVLSRGMLWSRTADGKPLRMIGTHTDITSRKVAEVAMSRTNVKLHTQIDEIRMLQTQLAEQAVRDPLTGLYNRRYLDETLEREVARARREGHPLSVVMLDVDHFKSLNDSYGHQAGDEVLRALADLLRQDTRAEDVACRYGGEEFLVLLPSMPLEKARERAEHWRAELEGHTFTFGNFALSVTASFGVSSYPHHGKTPDDLTRAADTALYSAKHGGRNRVEMYEEAPIVFVTGKPPAAS